MREDTAQKVRLWETQVLSQTRKDGSILVWQAGSLEAYPDRLSDRIRHWAEVDPGRTWMAERNPAGEWARISYGELAEIMPSIGGGLLQLGLSAERPLLILSGNSLEHAVIALSAQFVGVPSAAIAPAYALAGGDYAKLKDVVAQITPGAVFAKQVAPFAASIASVFAADVPVVGVEGELADRELLRWSELPRESARRAAIEANLGTGPDTVAKFLFTSGTTGSPKAVIQTQRMMCSAMAMTADCYAFMREEPPIFLDWAPWNHVAAGNQTFNMALYNGGTYYIDAGKPVPGLIEETIRNLREVSPTWYFNVPVGFDALAEAMTADKALRDKFFRDVKVIVYAGAGMALHTWRRLRALSMEAVGYPVLMQTGLGSTETTPPGLNCTDDQEMPGNVGIPFKGITAKLVPVAGDKLELRFKGPNVTPGYWRRPDLTAAAFDEEGFYCIGDAVKFAEPGDASKGFRFDGRIGENFKLSTGTWVAVGALRAHLINELDGLVRDAVIVGENRDELGALLVPARDAAERLAPASRDLTDADLFGLRAYRDAIEIRLSRAAEKATGSSTRVTRAIVLVAPLDFNRGEVTDKGSVNQRAVVANRPEVVDALYAGATDVILAKEV